MRTPDQVTISITEECPNRCAHCALPDSGNKLQPVSRDGQRPHRPDSGYGNHAGDIRWRGACTLPGAAGAGAGCGRSGHLHPLHLWGGLHGRTCAQQLKEAGLYAVNVSLDSPVAEEHDAMRGRAGVFQEAMQAVENALQPACWWTSMWSCAARTCIICRSSMTWLAAWARMS